MVDVAKVAADMQRIYKATPSGNPVSGPCLHQFFYWPLLVLHMRGSV